jgi:CHAT domain-containing protein/tetratricopeptide (TPR) repeat protein
VVCASTQTAYQDYTRSVELFDQNVRDSSLYYAQRAVQGYEVGEKPDSALLAVIMVSKNEAILSTLTVSAATIAEGLSRYGKQLSSANPALLSALIQRGHVFAINYQYDSALHYLNIVYDRMDWDAEPTAMHIQVLTQIGFTLQGKREYAEAQEYAMRAHRYARTVHGPDAKQIVPVVHTMCMLFTYTSQYDSALVYAREMLRLNTINYPTGHANIGIAHNELGTIFQNLCQYDSAIHHRKKCEEIFYQNYLKEGQGRFLAVAYGNLGYLYWTMEEYDLALQYNLKSLALSEEQYGPNSPALIFDLAGVAEDYEGLGEPEKALPYLWRAYQIQKESGPQDWANMAYCENFLANTHAFGGNYDSSKFYARLAIDHYAKAQMGDNKISVNAIGFMGQALLHLGDTLEAEKYLLDAERRFARFNVPWHQNVINMTVERAHAARYHSIDSAQALIDKAFLNSSLAKSCHTSKCIRDSLFLARHVLNLFQEQIALIPLKFPHDPHSAAREADLWISRYESVASRYLGQLRSDSGIRLVATTNQKIFDAGAVLHYRAWEVSRDQAHFDRILEYITKGKALTLRLKANSRRIQDFANLPAGIHAQEKALMNNVVLYHQNMLQDSSFEARKVYSSALEEFIKFKSVLKNTYPQYYALKFQLSVPSRQTLQRHLGDTERYIEFAFTDSLLLALIIDSKNTNILTFRSDIIRPRITQYAESIISRDVEQHQVTSTQLYTGFVEGLLPDDETHRLIIGPDEELYSISFESILHPVSKRYLVEDFVIMYAPSIDAWLETHANPGTGRKHILDFTPGFQQALKDIYLRDSDTLEIDSSYLRLLSQPFMMELSHQIALEMGSKSFRGEQATETNYKRFAGKYQLLHLGTHATLDDSNPLYSRLILAKDSAGTEDGYLHTYEIYGIPMQAELAVLTACETGSGRFQSGQGIESLAHAFAYAGCPAMIMSLWSIDEKSTADITEQFYQHLNDGMTKSEALTESKRNYLQSAHGELRHPFYWSGLVLMGSDGEVPLKTPIPWWAWSLAALLVVSGIFILIRRAYS